MQYEVRAADAHGRTVQALHLQQLPAATLGRRAFQARIARYAIRRRGFCPRDEPLAGAAGPQDAGDQCGQHAKREVGTARPPHSHQHQEDQQEAAEVNRHQPHVRTAVGKQAAKQSFIGQDVCRPADEFDQGCARLLPRTRSDEVAGTAAGALSHQVCHSTRRVHEQHAPTNTCMFEQGTQLCLIEAGKCLAIDADRCDV